MARLYIIGAGTPTPTPTRFGSAYVLEIEGEKIMFDCGPAATHKLVQAGRPISITSSSRTTTSITTSTIRAFCSLVSTSR